MATIRFTLRQLDIFAAVLRTGQVKRAAEALHLSQAAVSQALNELAAALGLTLFERRGREIVPTASARQLMSLAAQPMAALEDLAEKLAPNANAARPLDGDIRLAASSTIARYILPAALAALRDAHPALAVTMLSGNSVQVEQHVVDLEADIGFIEGPGQRDDLDVHGWGTDALQIIAPPDYAIDGISLNTLDAHAWVAREPGSGTRAVFEQSLARAGRTPPRTALVIDDSGAIVRAVAAGAGLACVSRLAAIHSSAANPVRYVDLPGLSLVRPLWRLRRAIPVHTPFVENFLYALEAALAEIAASPRAKPY